VVRSEYAELWAELERRLVAVIDRLEGVLPTKDRHYALDFIDHNEFALAWEQVVDALTEDEITITGADLHELLEIASLMEIPPTANRSVALAALAHEE
jgi:hypothetical protein